MAYKLSGQRGERFDAFFSSEAEYHFRVIPMRVKLKPLNITASMSSFTMLHVPIQFLCPIVRFDMRWGKPLMHLDLHDPRYEGGVGVANCGVNAQPPAMAKP